MFFPCQRGDCLSISKLIQKFHPPKAPSSFFISFEGIEGSGKSTQISRCKDYLESCQLRVLSLREPGGTYLGEKLRRAILDCTTPLDATAQMHLFAAGRAQLLQEVILPELSSSPTIVICDRFIDSTLTYQGYGKGLGAKAVLQCHQNYPLNIVPHITFYLKIDLSTSNQRVKKRGLPTDYFERQGDNFYKKVLQGYEEACNLFPQRIRVIEQEGDEDAVFGQIKYHLEQLIK